MSLVAMNVFLCIHHMLRKASMHFQIPSGKHLMDCCHSLIVYSRCWPASAQGKYVCHCFLLKHILMLFFPLYPPYSFSIYKMKKTNYLNTKKQNKQKNKTKYVKTKSTHTYIHTPPTTAPSTQMEFILYWLLVLRSAMECGWYTSDITTLEKKFSLPCSSPITNWFLFRGGTLGPFLLLGAGI